MKENNEYNENWQDEKATLYAKILVKAKKELETELGEEHIPPEYIGLVFNAIHMDIAQKNKQTLKYGSKEKESPKHNAMTEKQKKAIFVITHYYDKINKAWISKKEADLLPEDWENKMTFDEASNFIDEHGNKK